jgi:hypothetical protein
MVESVAAMALRARLRACDEVRFNVGCTLPDLIAGQVHCVEMIGRGFHSPQGLKARL